MVTCFYRRLSHAVAIACAAGFALAAEPATAEVTYKVLSFDDLEGWAEDDHSAALTVFQNTCRDMDDPVELFFLQIQGSGRIRLPNGNFIRVGYSGANGHLYRSLGAELVRRKIYEPHQVSAQVIKNWVRRNPIDGRELLFHSPSYVFFRNVDQVPADRGPLGAMNRSITQMRSVAVDPKFVKLGSPVWLEKDGKNPIRRLMTAQDTGSAIKGAQRADVFVGTGQEAGRVAGRLRDPGRMMVLMPIQRAYALLPEDT